VTTGRKSVDPGVVNELRRRQERTRHLLSKLQQHRESGTVSAEKKPRASTRESRTSEDQPSLLKKRSFQEMQNLKEELEGVQKDEMAERSKIEELKSFNYTHILMKQKSEFLQISNQLKLPWLDASLDQKTFFDSQNGIQTSHGLLGTGKAHPSFFSSVKQ
jgi:hypothetical protein